ncbi:MAG: hypothetical protein KDA21_03965 [Phycisphaerales bacterium]|nr:hypothetical protein [Phycisphaerales bacterium]
MITPSQPQTGALLYVGIDEAGYGPTLGPLTTALTVFEVEAWDLGGRPPNLWSALRRTVCRNAADTRKGRIAINDSKQLKLPNSSAKRHPLTHLERGVLAFIAAHDPEHTPLADDQALLQRLGTTHAHLPWYTGQPIELPLSTTADHVRLLAAQLDRARRRAGVTLHAARARLLPEDLFNQRLENMQSKARVSFSLVEELLREFFRAVPDALPDAVRIVIDRQGGRTAYADALARALPKAGIRTLAESPRASSYEISPPRSSPWAASNIRVLFTVDAEQDHLPVALASMTAKLTRELAMMRFNRHFGERISELKPTAGYATDARRWLEDAGGALTTEERRLLVRRA